MSIILEMYVPTRKDCHVGNLAHARSILSYTQNDTFLNWHRNRRNKFKFLEGLIL